MSINGGVFSRSSSDVFMLFAGVVDGGNCIFKFVLLPEMVEGYKRDRIQIN